LHLLLYSWGRPFHYSCDLDQVHANFTFRYDQVQVLDGGLLEFTFVVLEEKLVFMKSFKDESCDAMMLFNGFCEDEDVIEVDADNTFHDEVLENVVHYSLEGGGRVSESKKITRGSKRPWFI
jgi:hypothetical protein